MSRPQDYGFPFPAFVETLALNPNDLEGELSERGYEPDVCFLIQHPTLDSIWYAPSGENESQSVQGPEAKAWNLELLSGRHFAEPKRFHILPPLDELPLVAPITDEDAPGVILFKTIHEGLQPPSTAINQADHARRVTAKLRELAALSEPPIHLLMAVECVYGFSCILNTSQSYDTVRNALAGAVAQRHTETNSVNAINQVLAEQIRKVANTH